MILDDDIFGLVIGELCDGVRQNRIHEERKERRHRANRKYGHYDTVNPATYKERNRNYRLY